jgi:hypothetical protein
MRFTTVANAHTHGVLDPQMRERQDTKFVAGSLDDAENIITLPQGGYVDRGGSKDFGRMRRKLQHAPALTAAMITSPSGGTTAHLVDDASVFTVSADGGGNLSEIEINLGVPARVDFIELNGAKIIHGAPAAGQTPTAYLVEIEAEYFNGVNWVQFGQKITLRSDVLNNVRIGFSPGTAPPLAQQYRLKFPVLAANSTFECKRLCFVQETGEISQVRGHSYLSEDGQSYTLIFGHEHLDIFRDGIWLTSTPFPGTESIVEQLNFESQFDTIFVTHIDMQSQSVRRATENSWTIEPVQFQNVPNYDYGAGYTNGETEKQSITLYDVANGDKIELTVNGMATAAFDRTDVTATMISRIKSAIEALKNVEPGITVTSTGTNAYQVEFTGDGNSRRPWLKMIGYVNNPKAHISIERLVEGERPGEPIISDLRGWPAAIKIIQSRALLLGPKSLPNGVIASVLGDPLNLNMDFGGGTAAFIWEVDMDEPAPITDAIFSNALVLMTRNGVHFMMNEEMSADEAPDFRSASAPGISNRAPILRTDNALMYVDQQGSALRLLKFSQLDQNYLGENISVLSAHLIKNPSSIALLKANSEINAELCLMAMEDGSMVTLTMMRTQDVSGFCPQRTNGQFKSILVDKKNTVWWIVSRDNQGVEELRLEQMEIGGLLDSAQEYQFGSPQTTIPDLHRFNGKEVWAIAHDELYGPFLVDNGQIVLPDAVTACRVGTWSKPFATDPPVKLEHETDRPLADLMRVFDAKVSIMNTSSLAISANGNDPIDMSLIELDQYQLDTPTLQNKKTGRVVAEGFPGWTPDGQVTLTQVRPGKLNVRALTKSVAIS